MDFASLIVYIDYIFGLLMDLMDRILKAIGIKWVEDESGTGFFDKIFG